jgi:hypothetical protein
MPMRLLSLCLIASACSASAGTARTHEVASRDALAGAIARAQDGDRIILAGGDYGDVDIRGKAWTSDVTLVSATPANPARFDTLTLNRVSHLTIKSIEIGRPLRAGEPSYAIFANLRNVNAVTLDGVFIRGSLDDNPVNDGNGLNVVGSQRVTVKASRFEQLGRGIQMSGSTGLRLIGNDFRAMRSDGMNFANVQQVLIDRNHFRDFFVGEGDHPDAIQFWTLGTTKASTDIVISNNQVFQGQGAGTQGIFLTDQVGSLPYANVRIENNLLYVEDGYNGIMIGNGRQITISGNSVLSPPGDRETYWIRLDRVEGAVLRGNIADTLVNPNSRAVEIDGNIFLDKRPGYASRLRDLRARAAATSEGLTTPGVGYQPVAR